MHSCSKIIQQAVKFSTLLCKLRTFSEGQIRDEFVASFADELQNYLTETESAFTNSTTLVESSLKQMRSFLRSEKIQENPVSSNGQLVISFCSHRSHLRSIVKEEKREKIAKFINALADDENSLLEEAAYIVRGHSEDFLGLACKEEEIGSVLRTEIRKYKCTSAALLLTSDRESCGRCMEKVEEIQAAIQNSAGLPTKLMYVSTKNLKDESGKHDLGDYDQEEVESMNLSTM